MPHKDCKEISILEEYDERGNAAVSAALRARQETLFPLATASSARVARLRSLPLPPFFPCSLLETVEVCHGSQRREGFVPQAENVMSP